MAAEYVASSMLIDAGLTPCLWRNSAYSAMSRFRMLSMLRPGKWWTKRRRCRRICSCDRSLYFMADTYTSTNSSMDASWCI